MRRSALIAIAQKVRRGARRVVDPIPVTALGVLAAGVFWVGLEYLGKQRMDVVLLVACSAGLGLVAISVVSVMLFAIALRFRARRLVAATELTLETGRLTPTGWVLPTFGYLPLVAVRWEWEYPEEFTVDPVRKLFRREERIRASRRGRHRGVRRRVVVEDVFRLARVAFRVDDPVAIEVRPHPGRLGRMEPLTAFAGGDDAPHPMGIDDGDRTDLRRYAPGDPARFIHWKVFARTRKLVVRVPERALSTARRTAAYFVAGPEDEASAGAARVAVERGALGRDWVFGADGAATDADNVADAVSLIVGSAVDGSGGASGEGQGAGLAAFVARAERSGPAALVVFAPLTKGPWIDAVHQLAARRPGGLRVVIGVDGLVPAPDRGPLARLLTRAGPVEGSSAEVLNSTLRALGHARVDVVVYDRPTGRRLGGAHVSRSRRAKKSVPSLMPGKSRRAPA
ncbi:MAG: hypothetical protein DRJ42_00280 [Deltaproteobacteria bacterium]|nr:MAG: hypothetical protein DRJ42_00280 [Deltaproteobacteria bacterium]